VEAKVQSFNRWLQMNGHMGEWNEHPNHKTSGFFSTVVFPLMSYINSEKYLISGLTLGTNNKGQVMFTGPTANRKHLARITLKTLLWDGVLSASNDAVETSNNQKNNNNCVNDEAKSNIKVVVVVGSNPHQDIEDLPVVVNQLCLTDDWKSKVQSVYNTLFMETNGWESLDNDVSCILYSAFVDISAGLPYYATSLATLGDKVLSAHILLNLLGKYPKLSMGALTIQLVKYIRNESLNQMLVKDLISDIVLRTDRQNDAKLVATTVEAMIGALFVWSHNDTVCNRVMDHIAEVIIKKVDAWYASGANHGLDPYR